MGDGRRRTAPGPDRPSRRCGTRICLRPPVAHRQIGARPRRRTEARLDHCQHEAGLESDLSAGRPLRPGCRANRMAAAAARSHVNVHITLTESELRKMKKLLQYALLLTAVLLCAAAAQAQAPAKTASPAIVPKVWKGDLDGMLKRRHIRVL